MAMRHFGAKDWDTKLTISSKNIDKKDKIEYHHIIPKDLLKKAAVAQEKIDDMANLTFIGKITNIKISNNEPEQYLDKIIEIQGGDILKTQITSFDDMREFYALHILPNLNCRFSMSLRPEYYEMVKTGEKDIELRLYDGKRRKMHNGDILLIYDARNRNDYIQTRIVRLHIARSFADLATKISMPRTGFASLGALMSAISKFYDAEMESKYGIVGIELEVIRL